ncbi:MAG: hypothetical protein Q7R80_00175 [bacterium]|nr:hypothetical protein [bacterium]
MTELISTFGPEDGDCYRGISDGIGFTPIDGQVITGGGGRSPITNGGGQRTILTV